jgi:hypothetical protein
MCHYYINHAEKAIVCSETGELIRPHCFAEIALYVSYLQGGKGHKKEVNTLLKRVFKGEKVISDMIMQSQMLHLG